MCETVATIDKAIKDLYQLQHLEYQACDFLSSKPLTANTNQKPGLFEILKNQHSNELQLSIFLDPTKVLGQIESFKSWRYEDTWSLQQLQSFIVATEEISHFNYLLFHQISLTRAVTQLEMELQAEVDQFVVCYFTRNKFNKWNESLFQTLMQNLFLNAKTSSTLSIEEFHRYENARKWGSKCIQKWRRLSLNENLELDFLRRFFRAPLDKKLELLHGHQL